MIDIDIKCGATTWLADEWLGLDKAFRAVVATYKNEPIGMCVFRRTEEGFVEIIKLGVKNPHRRQGIGRKLIAIAMSDASLAYCSHVSLMVPEHRLRPGDVDDVSEFLVKLGFKAELPLNPNYFWFFGEFETGVRFTHPVPIAD